MKKANPRVTGKHMNYKPALNILFCTLLSSPALLIAGQAPSDSPQKSKIGKAPASAKRKIDVCLLLTSAEIEAVQGEPVKEARPSVQPNGSMRMSQCLFRTATFAKSVTVALVAPAPGKSSALTPRKFWRTQFHPPEPKDEEERPVPGEAPDKVGSEGEEEAPKPRHIGDLGEESYWVGNGITGALYVLQGDVFLRISIGGVHEESARIEKAKALACDVMKRLCVGNNPFQ
jgi:hypothetical protein